MPVFPEQNHGFFIGEVGARDPGFINRLKYLPCGQTRLWLFFWRMQGSTYRISRMPEQGPPMSRWQVLRYTLMIIRQLYWS